MRIRFPSSAIRRFQRPIVAFFMVLAPLWAMSASAEGGSAVSVGDLTIVAPWTRQSPPGATVGGGYLTITNSGSKSDTLVGGSADFAGRVEIHEMSVVDDVMRMRELTAGLPIASGETVELKPGGLHLMFMDLVTSPKKGDTVVVKLTFQRTGKVELHMPVAAIGASSAHGEATDHSGMKHGKSE